MWCKDTKVTMTQTTVAPLRRDESVLEFLGTRRSRPAKILTAPAPSRDALRDILTLAARTPDHGALVPWRFLVLGDAALTRYADALQAAGERLGIEQANIDKPEATYRASPLAVAVIASPKPAAKVPEIEQLYSAAAVCLSLVNAALASGWGASWVSGWHSHDPEFAATQLGVARHEKVAGIVHIGTATMDPPERPRPDIDAITVWQDT